MLLTHCNLLCLNRSVQYVCIDCYRIMPPCPLYLSGREAISQGFLQSLSSIFDDFPALFVCIVSQVESTYFKC